MSTGSSNGRGWGVIDLRRNQSACWESTVRPEHSREGEMVRGGENEAEDNKMCYSQVLNSRVEDSTCLAHTIWPTRHSISYAEY